MDCCSADTDVILGGFIRANGEFRMSEEKFDCFDVSIKNNIAHICLNRPEKRNSMIPEFWEQLPKVIADIDDNARARVIVISSTGPVFSAGMDLAAFAPKAVADKEEARRNSIRHGAAFYDTARKTQATFNALESCRLPILAAIQGGCVGGGVDMITACDMRYATEDAFFTIFETNIGMTADVGTFPRLVQQMPEGLVRELAYTGRRMPAAEAKAVGLVNQTFADQASMLDWRYGHRGRDCRKSASSCLRLQAHDQLFQRSQHRRHIGLHCNLECFNDARAGNARGHASASREASRRLY